MRRMKLGALLGPIVDAGAARTIPDQAAQLEAEGFDSLWSAQALGRGFMLTDPFVALSAAAAATSTVELGTAVIQVPLYAPGALAHQALSLRQVAGPRLSLGVGAGSTANDFAVHERDYDDRFRRYNTSINEMRQALNEGGTDGYQLAPWPEVQGDIPLLFGSWGDGVERAARHYDGWIASNAYRTADEVVAAHARYSAAGGGRAIVSTIQLTAETDLGELAERLDRFATVGFETAVVMFMPGGPSPTNVRALVPR